MVGDTGFEPMQRRETPSFESVILELRLVNPDTFGQELLSTSGAVSYTGLSGIKMKPLKLPTFRLLNELCNSECIRFIAI